MKRIVYLNGPKALSDAMRSHLDLILRASQLNLGMVQVVNIHNEVKDGCVEKKVGNQFKAVVNRAAMERYTSVLRRYIGRLKPDILVISDPCACFAVSGGIESIAKCRGSIYYFDGIPCIVVDNLYRVVDTNHGKWVAVNDWRKVARFVTGQLRAEPAFSYTVCRTKEDLADFVAFMDRSPFKTTDIETYDDWISCIGFTGCVDGRLHSWVVPFFNPTKEFGCHWDLPSQEEIAWKCVRRVLANEAVGILQNGSYDSSLFIKYRSPINNYLVDTMHMWHCLYAELPKRLDFIASICVDHYTFWKEESKGDKNERFAPTTNERLERFWRYCALDNYFTTLSAMQLVKSVVGTDWATRNYTGEFSRQVGPALAMACRGLLVDFNQLQRFNTEWETKSDRALQRIRIMADDPEFNPGSPKQVAELIYGVLGAKGVNIKGKEGGTDEITLKRVSTQHPLIKIFADAILDYREASKVVSTYTSVRIRKKRLHYSMDAAGTDTSRFASGTFLWEGLNAQTIPDHLRSVIISDPGYLFFDIDLEQSDARYVAYESQDAHYIENMESGKDTHCLHAAHFFKESYEDIYAKVKAGVERYAHKVTGIRSVTKKIVHGANYQMQAATLYNTMVKDLGREAVWNAIAVAFNLDYNDVRKLDLKIILNLLERILNDYHILYPGLHKWHRWIEAAINKDKKLTTAFGWTRVFFGKSNDPVVQRAATAFLGQGDTAGNINRAMDLIYYGVPSKGIPPLDGNGIHLLLQVHDSLLGQFHHSQAEKLLEVSGYLELPVRIHGREMSVPSAVAIGRRWGDKNLVKPTREDLSNGNWKRLVEAKG